ncbi:GNAT family N-acetyltransferase [Staphylococcus aureus]
MLGLVVAPNYQGQGIAGRLLNYFETLAKNHHRHGVTLTCRESLISFYENMGIVMKVLSESCHGGIKWYNLVKNIKKDDEV